MVKRLYIGDLHAVGRDDGLWKLVTPIKVPKVRPIFAFCILQLNQQRTEELDSLSIYLVKVIEPLQNQFKVNKQALDIVTARDRYCLQLDSEQKNYPRKVIT